MCGLPQKGRMGLQCVSVLAKHIRERTKWRKVWNKKSREYVTSQGRSDGQDDDGPAVRSWWVAHRCPARLCPSRYIAQPPISLCTLRLQCTALWEIECNYVRPSPPNMSCLWCSTPRNTNPDIPLLPLQYKYISTKTCITKWIIAKHLLQAFCNSFNFAWNSRNQSGSGCTRWSWYHTPFPLLTTNWTPHF